jgi:FHA domain-containing protein
LLKTSANGTVELLLTRAAVKREVRASSTMLLTGDNNPLKFSPTGEAALAHLLSPPAPGFMPAVPALRDAFDDLSAHQAGFAAGMRAALDGVLSRFDPGVLEARLVQRSFLQSLVPGKRQARMWEAFGQYYAQIRQEATDDFQTLLGNEFLKAYEAYVQSSKESEA